MCLIKRLILKQVKDAGHWGILRTSGLISPELFRMMAERAGMSTNGGYAFKNDYFADGTKKLPKCAITQLCYFFGIDEEELEELNETLQNN